MNKKNLVLGGILVVLLVLVYLYQGPLQNQGQENNFLSNVNAEEVDRIEITRENATTTTLIKEGDSRWQVKGEGDFYVISDVAGELEDKLGELVEADFELVSTNKDKKDEFHTNEDSGTRVVLYRDGEQVADFISGRTDSSVLNSTYVSRFDSSETYSVQGVNVTSVMSRNDWRSKVIFDSTQEDMNKVRFQYPDREFMVEKMEEEGTTTTTWQGVEPRQFEVSEEKMDEVLQIMTDLEATRIPEQTFEGTGLSEHLIIVEASGDDTSNTIMVGTKDGKEGEKDLYYAKKGSSDNIYLITGEQRDKLDQTMASLQ